MLKRLLFVDNEAGIRNTLPVILRRYGFTVTVAATVDEGLEQVRNEEFDLLLCDLNIHVESDGYIVIRAMQERNPQCVCIVLTGYPAVESAVEGLRLGIDDYITKPASADALVAALGEKLTGRHLRGTGEFARQDSDGSHRSGLGNRKSFTPFGIQRSGTNSL